jgi:hypothetical protein
VADREWLRGVALGRQPGQALAALQTLQQAEPLQAKAAGPRHPDLALLRVDLALAAVRFGAAQPERASEARLTAQRALAAALPVLASTLPLDHDARRVAKALFDGLAAAGPDPHPAMRQLAGQQFPDAVYF